MNRFLCSLIIILSIITLHPGMTDENGGHYDRSTGEYHYHHGYPAHQHPNGVCPYDFDDKTGQNSGMSSGNSDSNITRSSAVDTDDSKSDDSKRSVWDILETIFLVFVFVYSVYRIIWVFFVQPRLEERFWQERNRSRFLCTYKSKPQLSEPPVEKVKKFLPSPYQQNALDSLSAREYSVLLFVSVIVSKYLDGYDYNKNQEFISAFVSSILKIEDKPSDGIECTAKRIISRACYSYLLYLKNNNLLHAASAIPPKEVLRMFCDTMQWLRETGYYSPKHYNTLVNAINESLNKHVDKEVPHD